MSLTGPSVSIKLDTHMLNSLVVPAKDFCYTHGIIVRMKNDPSIQDTVSYFPFSLFPSPVPRHCYELAQNIQQDFNLLMHKVANDYAFLNETLKGVIAVDDFTRRLWEIYAATQKEGYVKPVSLALHRSDYMIDVCSTASPADLNNYTLKQVEFNTMAAGCCGNSPELVKLHRYILSTAGHPEMMDNIATSDSCEKMAKAMLTAWKCYNNQKSVIIFLVLPKERNTYDQRLMEYGIKEQNPCVQVIYRTFKDINERGVLNSERCLVIDCMEVAVIYQRCGYSPQHFPTEQEWATRLLMERSRAVICPSVSYHLAGTKKVQQVLALPGTLERFLSNEESIKNIRSTFVGLHNLDLNEEGDANSAMAIKTPHRYVLKPQREGGGNNLYDDEISQTLQKIGRTDERTSYILMDKISPYTFHNYPVLPSKPVQLTELVSELGIFGSLVGTAEEIILNQNHGFLLRSKNPTTNEGGVMTESAVLDSPYLVS